MQCIEDLRSTIWVRIPSWHVLRSYNWNKSGSYPALDIFPSTKSGAWFNIKMLSYHYRKSHCGDKTVVRSSYLHNGISYTSKMSSLYWIGAQVTEDCLLKKATHAHRTFISTPDIFVHLNNLYNVFFTFQVHILTHRDQVPHISMRNPCHHWFR